jgi:hypothetical protein
MNLETVTRRARTLLRFENVTRGMILHQTHDQLRPTHYGQTRRVKRNPAVTVRRTVNWIYNHSDVTITRDARFFTHHPQPGTAKNAQRDFVRCHV